MIDERTFRDALGRFATGVTVVSMDTEDGPRGITVSAFLSLSLHPPLVGVSIDERAGAHATLTAAERYGVSILAEEQRPLSDRFAGRPLEVQPDWIRLGGAPVLDRALVQLDCVIVDRHRTGDHTLFVGRIDAAATRDGTPLLYHRGGYGVG
jgi:flavin reductase (DIM6/NTAB) family NADH-FMN oxidoreductase RutF